MNPENIFPTEEEVELYEIERAAKAYKSRVKLNRDLWEIINNKSFLGKMFSRPVIPPPMPPPLPAKWEIIAKRMGWL